MKKLYVCILIAFFLSIMIVPQAFARSLSIDEVQIRAWIQPDGDLIVNEMFTYTFNGDYKNVWRSVHTAHHDGVQSFEAYEVLDPNAEVGFIDNDDIRWLDVSQTDNRYVAAFPASNESKKVIFIYRLTNAVKSYETYSDLTIPFFGTDENHEHDLHNVTIDIVFPDKVSLDDYEAFIHDPKGKIEGKTEEMVRFFTPVSEMYRLTETRVLFPSAIMTDQEKLPEAGSLDEAAAEEEDVAKSAAFKQEAESNYTTVLTILSVLFIIAALLLLFLPQRRLRGYAHPEDLLKYDPLYLYTINRIGRKDSYAFLAGIYSLVEKGYVNVRKTPVQKRIQKDPEAPKQTLMFTFKSSASVYYRHAKSSY